MRIRVEPFTIAETFPPSDPLAVDLLRVMAGYNDLAFVVEWVEAHLSMPEDFNEQTWAAGRLDFQLRLLHAIMHEILDVLEEMERRDGFSRLEGQMAEGGREALARLRQLRRGQDDFGRRLLAITRHKIAYHYDHGLFKKGLERVIERFGQDGRANLLVIEGRSGREQYYFSLADGVRAQIVDEIIEGGAVRELDLLLDLTRAFGTFLESLLSAYAQDRRLSINFNLR